VTPEIVVDSGDTLFFGIFMAPNPRVNKAFSFMKALGISDKDVKPVLIKLFRVYEGNWELIEDDNYHTLVDAYFDFEKDKVPLSSFFVFLSIFKHIL